MCSACGLPAGPEHWTEAGAATPGDRHRAQARRTRMLRRVLGAYHLTVTSPFGGGGGFQLSSGVGAHVLVRDLGELWAAAEKMSGVTIDPLAPAFGDGG